MAANLSNPFGESCCEGGVCSTNDMSARSCGCDPGADYISPNCWLHNIREESLGIKVKEWESFISTKSKMPVDKSAYSFVGLAGEVGEVMEWYKKTSLRSTPSDLTEQDLLEELGDVLHYVTRLGLAYGWGLKDIMKANKEKLDKRYGRT